MLEATQPTAGKCCVVPVCASGTDLPPPVAALEGNWLAVVLQGCVAVGVTEWGEGEVRAVWSFLSALSGCVEECLALKERESLVYRLREKTWSVV